MFTTIDKAVVAILGGLLTIAAQAGLPAEMVGAFEPYIAPAGSLITGLLVYIWPNRAPSSPSGSTLNSHWIVAIGLFAALLLLGGCTTSGLTPAEKAQLTPAQRVYALAGEYDILLDQVLVYARQPECGGEVVIACADREVVSAAAQFARQADDALDMAELAVRTGDPGAANYAAAARMLVARLSAFVIARELGGGTGP